MFTYITRNNFLMDTGRDIFDEILPEKMEYFVVDEHGKPIIENGIEKKESFRDIVHETIIWIYGDRCINAEVEYWIQKYKTWFDPLMVSTLGKRYSIWMQNREFELDYVNLKEKNTVTRIEPVRNASLLDETPSTKDISEREFIQPTGAMGTAIKMRDSINAINNPLMKELYGMEQMFINEGIIERIMGYQCHH